MWGGGNEKRVTAYAVTLEYFGSRGRTRTYDTRINSPLIYRLIYSGILVFSALCREEITCIA